jgi:hypothetical protein
MRGFRGFLFVKGGGLSLNGDRQPGKVRLTFIMKNQRSSACFPYGQPTRFDFLINETAAQSGELNEFSDRVGELFAFLLHACASTGIRVVAGGSTKANRFGNI